MRFLLPMLLLLVGCASRRPPATDTQVRAIHFRDNGPWLSARSDAALRQAMGHPIPTGVWPLRKESSLDEALLEEDKRRLAVHYAHEGFFDARVTRWETVEIRPARGPRPPVVKVIGHVAPGSVSVAKSTRVQGTERLSTPIRRLVKRTLVAPRGDQFRLQEHEARISEAKTELANLSYARAEIRGEAQVDRDAREVAYVYWVEPDEPAPFGPIEVKGAEDLPQGVVDRAVFIEEGEPFSAAHLGEVQQRLYGLGVFSAVDIRPDVSGEGEVPVTIELSQRAPRGVDAAGGMAVESGRQEVMGRVGFEHLNAMERLLQFEVDLQGGYAFLAASIPTAVDGLQGIRSGPTADLMAAATLPIGGWKARLEGGYEHDITEAFVTDQPSLTTSFSGPIAPRWTLSLAYALTYNLYSDLQVDPDALRALEDAPDLREGQYFDTHLEQTLLWDTRDDVLMPSRGFRHSVTLIEAGRWLGGNYDYLGGQLDLRAYQPLGRVVGEEARAVVLAGRVGGGYLQPYGPEERRAVPVAERLYLGGSGSVRGWIYQHLGPYLCSTAEDSSCSSEDPDGAGLQSDTVPVGGRLSSMASLEVRRQWDRFGAVAFVDAGMVWARPDLVDDVPLLPSVGVGGRLQTPVGPLRADVAVRTDNEPRFEQEPRVWMHLGLGEAF